jgi:hypothetical protein
MTIPRWRLALVAGALVVLGAVGGGLIGAAATQPAAAADADADAMAATASGDALLLDSLAPINDSTSSGVAVPAQLPALRDRLAGRVAMVRGRLVHGTLTVLDRDGKLVTYQLDHGTVSAVGGASITIAEAGGSSVTVATTSATRVRKDAKPSTLADLKIGDEVVVRSTVTGGSATANLVVVPPASPAVTSSSSGGGNG